ncbi:galectin-8-like [Syngnathus acus]|uniref:galectin-8-like n=1 Tax=Syngnathus acus TaxID=161584 RepID=UPI00188600C0|nr:galectin-8-like [Syngnathus acus]
MSARFNWLTDVNVLVMNSYLSGKWGKEERKQGTSFPFGRGQFFEMIVKCTAKFFNMTINGDVHLSYKYRAPVAKIDRVGAKGNVTLIDIRQI